MNQGYSYIRVSLIFAWRAAGPLVPRRAKNPLYHTTSLFVNRKIKQNIILPDPEICTILPIAFLVLFAYNNNCQGDKVGIAQQQKSTVFLNDTV
jgi:hypothetical protein